MVVAKQRQGFRLPPRFVPWFTGNRPGVPRAQGVEKYSGGHRIKNE
jgi:hypothetical protein